MNKHYLIAVLVIIIGISAAASDKPGKVDYSISGFNPEIVSSGDTEKVIIKDGSFQPSEVTIAAGDRVEWHNQDETQHTVVSDDQGSLSFSSGKTGGGIHFQLSEY